MTELTFTQINPEEIKIGTHARLSFLASTYKVIEITSRGKDLDNTPFVCGYMQKDDGFKMSFAYKKHYAYMTFLNV